MKRRTARKGSLVVVALAILAACTTTHHVSRTVPAEPSHSTPPSPISTASGTFTCGKGGQLASIHMVTAAVGWAITEDFPECGGAQLLGIVRTTDGGRTWRDVTPPAAVGSTFSASFVDSEHAWTVAALASGAKTARVLRTDDGGKIWHTAGAVRQYAFCCAGGTISFVDDRNGWIYESLGAAAGSEGVAVLRSQDGGSSWRIAAIADGDEQTSSGLTFSCDKGISVSGVSTAWAAGTCADIPLFLVTRNGARSWSNVHLPWPMSIKAASIDPPIFVTPLTGVVHVTTYVGGRNSTGFEDLLFATHDAGRSWRNIALPKDAGIVSPDVLDATHWWLIRADNKPRIFITDDGGRHWLNVTPGIRLDGTQVLLLGSRRAIDVPLDRNGPMMETVNGGHTWHIYTLVIR